MKKIEVNIDGSVLEGGGQVVRTAVALSVLAKKTLRIYNIRAGRSPPGLRTQHLRGVLAAASLCGAECDGLEPGSKELWFYPGKASLERLSIRIETAGSIGLVLQTLMLAAAKSGRDVRVGIEGGATFGKWAPPLAYMQQALLPLLRKSGYVAEINTVKEGFYPSGHAKVNALIKACEGVRPFRIPARGEITSLEGVSIASAHLRKARVAERQTRACESALRAKGYEPVIKTRYVDAHSPGCGIAIAAKTGDGVIGANAVGEQGKPAEAVGKEAAAGLIAALSSGAGLDAHMGDQLLPYMALAEGESSITVPEVTLHSRTNQFIIEKFLPVKFSVAGKGAFSEIQCKHV
jgi:RNA 3'-terminal phosphate cyclase (ATP)